jgi:NhaC family Na+:H+ antiporter
MRMPKALRRQGDNEEEKPIRFRGKTGLIPNSIADVEPIPKKPKPTRFSHALISVLSMAVIVLATVVGFDGQPQIALVFGCAIAGIVAATRGYSWNELLDGLVRGIVPSLEAVLILLLIGMLIGVWIAAGTVPALIYYGLMIINARFFLVTAFVICTIVSFPIGSWGAVGTVGLAFMGIGLSLGLPAPLVAGAIISGSYFGGNVSPLSDSDNLVAAVVNRSVFDVVRAVTPASVISFVLAAIIYTAIGFKMGGGSGADVAASIQPLLDGLSATFSITPIALAPLVIMIACIALRVPAIPSMLIGIVMGLIIAVPLQGENLGSLINISFAGFESSTGFEVLDGLLTAGGLSSMMNTISIIIIAMAYGGLMQSTGQMQALIKPIVSHIKRQGSLRTLTVISCVFMNAILPDQYLGISVPGQMYAEEFDKRGVDRADLGTCLLAGAGATSPLIPWNTCGIYCSSLLGIGALSYLTASYFCLIFPVVTIILGYLTRHGDKMTTQQSLSAQALLNASKES